MHVLSNKYGQVEGTLSKALENTLFYYITKSIAARRFLKQSSQGHSWQHYS